MLSSMLLSLISSALHLNNRNNDIFFYETILSKMLSLNRNLLETNKNSINLIELSNRQFKKNET